MVAERGTVTPTRVPGTKTDAMGPDSDAGLVVGRGSGGAQMWTPPSSSDGITPSSTASAGSGLADGGGVTPGAGSNPSSRGSVPTKQRDFQRVKERLAHVTEHMRSELKKAHEALAKEKQEREAQLPLLSELAQDKTSTVAGAVGLELQRIDATNESIQETMRSMKENLEALTEKVGGLEAGLQVVAQEAQTALDWFKFAEEAANGGQEGHRGHDR